MALPIAVGILGAVLPLLGDTIKRIFPDPEEARRVESAISMDLIEKRNQLDLAAASIVKAEASSESFLTSNWRPIIMLGFFGLICARWFGYSTPNMTEAEYIAAWDLLELGIGGYVLGRSAEKVVPAAFAAIKAMKQ